MASPVSQFQENGFLLDAAAQQALAKIPAGDAARGSQSGAGWVVDDIHQLFGLCFFGQVGVLQVSPSDMAQVTWLLVFSMLWL